MGNKILAGQEVIADALNDLPAHLADLTTGSVTNSVAETTIGTFSAAIAANDATTNSGYRLQVTGTTDTTATPTLRIRAYIGSIAAGNMIYDSTAKATSGAATGKPWYLSVTFLVTGTGTGGTASAGGWLHSDHIAASPVTDAETGVAIDTTAAKDILVTATWGTASASNTARTSGGSIVRT